MIAFDLLYLNGQDLRKLPLVERKTHLKKLIEKTAIQFSESFEVDGKEMFAHACKVGLEGVVSKVRDSRYLSGRGRDWVKKTCAQRETLTIAGFALDGNDWDGIYVGRRKGDDLIYAGKVDHGFDKKSSAELRKRLTPLIRKTQPYAKRNRAQGHLGGAGAERRDRVPRQVSRGKGSPSLLQGPAGGPVMDDFNRFWQWANKPLDSGLTISDRHSSRGTSLPPAARRDRAKVNEAVRIVQETGGGNLTSTAI